MESVTARLVRRFGPQVAGWCAGTPDLVARLASQWGLSLGESLPDGASSVALRCRLPDGTPAAPLPGQWSDLLTALHEVAPPPLPTRVLRGRCEEAFARVGRRLSEPAISARMDVTAWDRAVQRCERLLDTETTTVLLHGDLHLGNVLDGGAERGLMAIDPKACVGDPCFDAVDYVVAGAGLEGVETRCTRVAAACGLDGDRLYAWSRVIAPFAAIAQLGSGGEKPVIDELLALTSAAPVPRRRTSTAAGSPSSAASIANTPSAC
ncbi:aminoglycoside phosphotransferase family protein [Streptomyces xiamenensis]|uniref:aminoglycoside phosphotransferase family protein n=1 Tax=Streptomyces xiamenensis TaxID=408015 RepID=UPI0036EC832D